MDTTHFFRRAISRLARETLYRRMDDSAAFEILARTTAVLDALQLPWWLTDGTLLGFVREGGFIGHDIDVDLGLPASAHSSELEAALERAGLEIYGRYGSPENGLELTVRSRWLYLPGTSLDLFFFYEDGDSMWHAAYYKGHQLRYRYPRFETGPLEVRGVEYQVPHPPEAFLETKYGPNWTRPDPTWNNMLSPESMDMSHLPAATQAMIRAALTRT